jgi:hypothetical protein
MFYCSALWQFFCAVTYNTEKLYVGNNVEHFLRCGQQRRKIFSVVGNNAVSQLRTVKHFVSLSPSLKRQFTEIKATF